jgi:hypothetical protein
VRSPLFYPLNRGMDAEAGGAAELQTDVMRFMAIISMCLVAIFAIVQSIPLAPVVSPVPPATPAPVVESGEFVEPEAVPEPEADIVLTRPVPAKIGKVEATVPLQRPAFRTIERTSTAQASPEPDPIPAAKSSAPRQSPQNSVQKGFTLRFESDQALTRLVARDVVGLYAITAGQARRMNIESGTMTFWPASAPQQIHEMDAATVPEPVLSAYRRQVVAAATETKWGVSIPASMSQQLGRFLSGNSGGSLVIGLDGALRLEQ